MADVSCRFGEATDGDLIGIPLLSQLSKNEDMKTVSGTVCLLDVYTESLIPLVTTRSYIPVSV